MIALPAHLIHHIAELLPWNLDLLRHTNNATPANYHFRSKRLNDVFSQCATEAENRYMRKAVYSPAQPNDACQDVYCSFREPCTRQ